MDKQLVLIGKIVAPHGVRGYVRVMPLTDFPERFQSLKYVLLENDKELIVEDVKYHKKFVLLKFRGIESMNESQSLRDRHIYVLRKDAVELPEGHYFVFDIVGLKVFDVNNDFLGVITDVINTGSNDVYVVELEGRKPLLIPALKSVVKKIDIVNGNMIVELQEWD